MLCETDWQLRRSFNREIAADLAAELGMSFAFGPEFAIRRPSGVPLSFLGNAILSSAPLADSRMIALPSARMSRRYARLIGQPRALIATVEFSGRRITIAVAHLHSRWNPAGRARQMATAARTAAHWRRQRADDPRRRFQHHDHSASIAPWAFAIVAVRMAMRPWRFRYPERYEPLFEDLARAGFEVRDANVPGKATFTFARAIPPALRPKLDWIALRGLEPIPGSARVVVARESFFGPRCPTMTS